uniref:THAP domain-containing protein 5 n=1 Tax=Molossus molossus TaxID=27622 RepID=A0A7J8HFG0_MOLMO|nr:THAP domain containing 5 [Molossus molossus]
MRRPGIWQNCKNTVKFSCSNFRFPLHDKERLEKWLKNMKRDSWMPSKYQFLCSDHFTPDSLDIRWGIRYLKQTAVPTIFSLPEDNQWLHQFAIPATVHSVSSSLHSPGACCLWIY